MKTNRIIRLVVALLLIAIILAFAYQNLENVSVTFIAWSIEVPFSLAVLTTFLIGLITGVTGYCFLGKKKKTEKQESSSEIGQHSPVSGEKEE